MGSACLSICHNYKHYFWLFSCSYKSIRQLQLCTNKYIYFVRVASLYSAIIILQQTYERGVYCVRYLINCIALLSCLPKQPKTSAGDLV